MTTIPCTLAPGASLPVYQTAGAAGADVCACLAEPLVLAPGCRAMVPTGLSFEIPTGYEVQVRPRSGLAAKHGVTVLNSPGTIDSDYRGEVKVILVNLGSADFTISHGHPVDHESVGKEGFFIPRSCRGGTEDAFADSKASQGNEQIGHIGDQVGCAVFLGGETSRIQADHKEHQQLG